jgi:catechol 2,3-dioxygenase-like lactoylglutathione lyase family enzyme
MLMLPTPSFHHVHLNSTDPDAAIDFYTRRFPSARKITWGGEPALSSPNDVLVLFSKVDSPPASGTDTALWHFGWHVTDSRASLARYRGEPDAKLLPLYTSEDGEYVHISSDTWPGSPGVLGLTRSEIAEARASGRKPTRVGGFSYMEGPDGALFEYSGNQAAERFNHVHMWQNEPFCAQLWYQKHLNAPVMEGRASPTPVTEATCKVPRGAERTWPSLTRDGMFRSPRAGVLFGDVALMWYPPQTDAPLASAHGRVFDRIGLGVADLDAWTAKLESEDVKIVRGPYPRGDTRAALIEGPSGEPIELVEVG